MESCTALRIGDPTSVAIRGVGTGNDVVKQINPRTVTLTKTDEMETWPDRAPNVQYGTLITGERVPSHGKGPLRRSTSLPDFAEPPGSQRDRPKVDTNGNSRHAIAASLTCGVPTDNGSAYYYRISDQPGTAKSAHRSVFLCEHHMLGVSDQ